MPDQTLGFSTLSNVAGNQSIAIDRLAQGTPHAWVNFDGTTTPIRIRAAYNVDSITDGGVGLYTVNYSTPNPFINGTGAAAICTAIYTSNLWVIEPTVASNTAWTQSVVISYSTASSLLDPTVVNVVVF